MADAPGATVTGKSGTDYVLEFGTNMFCRLEEATGKAYVELLQELRGPFPSVRTVRAFVQAAWVNRNATADEAGLLIDDLGGWESGRRHTESRLGIWRRRAGNCRNCARRLPREAKEAVPA
jgi:hypothetical protein